VDDNNAAYYYHFDALGSVVALSDSTGDTVQTYEYSVYGEVSASDPKVSGDTIPIILLKFCVHWVNMLAWQGWQELWFREFHTI